MSRTHRFRLPVAAAAATAAALFVAAPAMAHVHTDPTSVEAGAESSVGFAIEHGCDGSPTVKMEIQMPDGATDISGVDDGGFTSSVDGQVVTFEGGTVEDGTEQAFTVEFTAPTEAGDVPVPIVQYCEEGQNDWIEIAVDGEPEPESPAPVLTITESGAVTTTTMHGGDHEETTTTEAEAEETTTTTEVAVDEADSDDDDSSSVLPVVVGVVIVAAIGGGAFAYGKSRNKTGDAGDGA